MGGSRGKMTLPGLMRPFQTESKTMLHIAADIGDFQISSVD